ncbi:MAG: hypothetical protein OXE78_01000 [Gammaproteobacteria bacterium]|nr:hypothetical protein [Gammaproteobacteria bacterium]MCY4357619.1 hypothetical protein [Gammaproteobacteria bacterium]
MECAGVNYGDAYNPRLTLIALSHSPAMEGLSLEDRKLLNETLKATRYVHDCTVQTLGRIGEICSLPGKE